MSRCHRVFLAASWLASSAAHASPPGAPPELRSGANHHVGDASFVAAFGRAPTDDDAEQVRMTTHLRHVHAWLASRPATRPELAERRARVLALLADYIAKATTPSNSDLPWRTPVFIDKQHTIARRGDLPRLHGLLTTETSRRARALRATARPGESDDAGPDDPGPACSGEVAISAARAGRLDVLLASRDKIRAVTPAMVRDLVLAQEGDARGDATEDGDEVTQERQRAGRAASDLVRVLAGHMAMFIEWPHVDRRFDQVYATMAGRYTAHWASYSEQRDDVTAIGE
jgi:hypothetical protein